jgi:integrase
MRGSIINRYPGSYSVVINFKDPATGKRRQRWITVRGSRENAKKRLHEALHEIDTGTFVTPQKTTLKDYLESWLRDTALPNMTPRTYEGYEFIVRKYIIPNLGAIPLTELKAQHIQHLCSEKQGAGLNRTAQYIFNTLNKSLIVAVKMGVLVRNPCDGVESPKVPRHEMQTMNETDLQAFLNAAKETSYYALFYLALFSGMRRSELLALRWQDVDLLLTQVSVNRTMHVMRFGTYKGQVIFKAPKTAKSRRLIALSPSTAIVLREYRDQQAKLRESLGLSPLTDADLVFSTYDGKPLLPDSVSHAWHKLAEHTGLNGIRLHDARHSHASLLLKQGIHPKIVQERLGHASIETTLDTYSHVAPGLQQAAANKFDDIVLPKETRLDKELRELVG